MLLALDTHTHTSFSSVSACNTPHTAAQTHTHTHTFTRHSKAAAAVLCTVQLSVRSPLRHPSNITVRRADTGTTPEADFIVGRVCRHRPVCAATPSLRRVVGSVAPTVCRGRVPPQEQRVVRTVYLLCRSRYAWWRESHTSFPTNSCSTKKYTE